MNRSKWFQSALLKAVLSAALLLAVWGTGSEAQAQYKHIAMGGSLGFLVTSNQGGDVAAPKGSRAEQGYGVGPSYIVIGGHGGYRFEDHFAVFGEAYISFHMCGNPAGDVCDADSVPIMLTFNTHLRIFFLTDNFRPYVNVGVGVWQSATFVKTGLTSFGPTADLGFEWFVAEEVALGVNVRYGLQFAIGEKGFFLFHSFQGGLVFTTYI